MPAWMLFDSPAFTKRNPLNTNTSRRFSTWSPNCVARHFPRPSKHSHGCYGSNTRSAGPATFAWVHARSISTCSSSRINKSKQSSSLFLIRDLRPAALCSCRLTSLCRALFIQCLGSRSVSCYFKQATSHQWCAENRPKPQIPRIDCVICEDYNADTCYHALDISRFPVSLAIRLSTSRGVKRTEKCPI